MIEARALHTLGKHSTTEPHHQCFGKLVVNYFSFSPSFWFDDICSIERTVMSISNHVATRC
jgi:hypothetical protein